MKEKTYQEEYEEFWKDIVENEDGTLNKDQIMRELSDYSMVMDNCAKAYYTMTNGRISKQNTMFFEVEGIFNDLYTDTSIYYEDIAEKDKEIEQLTKENTMLNQRVKELKCFNDILENKEIELLKEKSILEKALRLVLIKDIGEIDYDELEKANKMVEKYNKELKEGK